MNDPVPRPGRRGTETDRGETSRRETAGRFFRIDALGDGLMDDMELMDELYDTPQRTSNNLMVAHLQLLTY